jgi:hypothetical protein
LRDAAGQSWAFGDKHAVFIGLNCDAKFHVASLAIAGAVRNARNPFCIRKCRRPIRLRSLRGGREGKTFHCLNDVDLIERPGVACPSTDTHRSRSFTFSSDVDLTNGTAHRAITNRHIYAVAANAS